MITRNLTLAAALCCAFVLYLLGEQAPEFIALAPPPHAEFPLIARAEKTKSSITEADSEPEQEPAAQLEAPKKAMEVAYETPFPDRTNLFEAPKRQVNGRVTTDGLHESAIELLGFVNVYGPEVVLSIDGLATTIAEGAEHAGIEVISIQPPAVFLRRGKQRWQATLDN